MLNWQWLLRTRLRDGLKVILIAGTSILLVALLYILGSEALSPEGMEEGLFTEIVGILLTVLLIDGLRSIGSDIEVRKTLIRHAGSMSNETAKSAVDEMRKIKLLLAYKKDTRHTYIVLLQQIFIRKRGMLQGEDLSNADLRNVILDYADLRDTNLTNANLSHASLKGAVLDGANLTNANFSQANMSEVSLRQTLMTDTVFEGANLDNAVFKTKIGEAYQRPENMNSAKFSGASLINVDLSELRDLSIIDFSNCILHRANLMNTDLTSANLKKAELQGAILTNCILISANLAGIKCSEATNFNKAIMHKVDLTGSTCNDASFNNCELNQSVLLYSKFRRCKFHNAILEKCEINILTDFRNSEFNGSRLTEMRVTEVTKEEANKVKDTPFEGIKCDRDTILPTGIKWSEKSLEQYLSEEFNVKNYPIDEEDEDFNRGISFNQTLRDF